MPCCIYSQATLKGVVVEYGKSVPIEGLTIRVLNKDSTFIAGTCSCDNGAFEIKNVKSLPFYLISFSGIGYESTTCRITNMQATDNVLPIDTVYIVPASQYLKEVTIKGNSTVREIDRLIMFPNENIRKSSVSAWDVLEKLRMPNIVINKSSLTISTSEGQHIIYKINGVVADASEYLTINPNAIKSVTFIDNPSARYSNQEIGAIIDIKTREVRKGLSAGIRSENTLTTISTGNFIHMKVNQEKNMLSILYNNKYRHYKKGWNDTDVDCESSYAHQTLTMKGENMPYRYIEQNFSAIYNYTSRTMDLNIKFNDKWHNDINIGSKQDVFMNGKLIYKSIFAPHTSFNSPSLDVYSSMKITDKDLLSFDLLGTYKYNKYVYSYNEDFENTKRTEYGYNVIGNRWSFIGETIYEHSFNKNILECGIRINYAKTKNDYTKDINIMNYSHTSDIYGYIQLKGTYSRFSYDVGLGVEKIKYNEFDSYFDKYVFRPMFRTTYSITKGFEIGLTSKIIPHIPELSEMVDVTKSLNDYECEKGNPHLKPYSDYSNKINVTCNLCKLYLSGDFTMNYSNSPFAPECRMENDVIVYDMQMFDHCFSFSSGGNMSYDFIEDKLSMSFFCRFSDNIYKKGSNRFNTSLWNYGGKFSLRFSQSWMLDVALYDYRNFAYGMMKNSQEKVIYAEISYKAKECLFSLGVWNPFKKSVQLSENNYCGNGITKNISTFSKDKGNMVYIRVSLNISKGSKYKENSKKISNVDYSDGIKR